MNRFLLFNAHEGEECLGWDGLMVDTKTFEDAVFIMNDIKSSVTSPCGRLWQIVDTELEVVVYREGHGLTFEYTDGPYSIPNLEGGV